MEEREIDMKISAVATYKLLKAGDLPDKAVIVVNGLRSNAVIITALANGSDRVVAVDKIEDAIAIRKQFSDISVLCGAYDKDNPDGYEMGNSPQEYTGDSVRDKLIIHCSTNGSKAINACAEGEHVYIGSIVNATAVAKAALETQRDIYIVCSGLDGDLSLEDMFAAGCVAERLLEKIPNAIIDDTVQLMIKLYLEFKSKPLELLRGLKTFDGLIENGWESDIKYCLSEDLVPVVPEFSEGTITL